MSIVKEVEVNMFEKIKHVLIVVVCFIYFAFALSMTVLLLNFNDYGVTEFGETSLVILKEKVNFEGYNKGELVLVEKTNLKDFNPGETVFTYRVENKVAHIEIGKVGEVYENEEAISFENGETYSKDFIIGKPTKVYAKIGSVLALIESQWGFLFIILVPCFLLFIYQIFALVVEIKYGKDDE